MRDLIQLEQSLKYLAQNTKRVWNLVAKYFDQDKWGLYVSKLYGP